MFLKKFIEIIRDNGKISGSIPSIAIEICEKSKIMVGENTIEAWFKSGKSSRKHNYSGLIDRIGFISYFEKKTEHTWKDIQKAFEEHNKQTLSSDGIAAYKHIHPTTNNAEVFYSSLLEQFHYLLQATPISLQHIPPSKYTFIGRTQELKNIDKIFEDNNIVILNGIGGIGKSYIASEYSYCLNQNNEWIIQQINCEDIDNLQEAVLKLNFENLNESNSDSSENKFTNRMNALKNNLKPVLIILDNFNHSIKTSEYNKLKVELTYRQHIRFIITTRHRWNLSKHNMLHIEPLKELDLFSLYEKYRFNDNNLHTDFMNQHKKILNKLFLTTNNHTLMITLLAKLALESCMDEEDIFRKLSSSNLPEDSLTISKDNNDFEYTVYDLLKKLFDLAQLNINEQNIMVHLSFFSISGIHINDFVRITEFDKKNILSLINRNWIISDIETFKIHLHPLISEAVFKHYDYETYDELLQDCLNKLTALLIVEKETFTKEQLTILTSEMMHMSFKSLQISIGHFTKSINS